MKIPKSKIDLPENLAPSDARLSLMDQCYSCEDIIETFGEIEKRTIKNPDGIVQMYLVCKICIASNTPLTQTKENGKIDYIVFSLDSDGRMSTEFRNLKMVIKRHVKFQHTHLHQV